MEEIEFEGKTVDEAIEKAVQFFNVDKGKLSIEVISDGSQGLFGLIGSKKAKIKTWLIQDTVEEKKKKAQNFLTEILRLAKIPSSVEAELIDKKVFLTIKGDGSGLLIGKKGQTLDALQYLVSKMVNQKPEDRIPIIVDTENYRHRREAKLAIIAQKLGSQAKRQKKPVATELLNPQERRVIYLTLQNHPDLTAKSEGEGKLKKVIISPRNLAHKS
ncbi:MAG TPA: RNA-binding cell elongation regulator Jag/EloR [Thermodesulfobacteriota bacterium]|mgnify:CR=1 FL=1|nr:RNA-binding cell elongation regulator Jag/EloR [Thermodesulfobacteriota bacterium]